MGEDLTLERFAALSARLEAGQSRRAVLADAGVSEEDWLASQRSWLDEMSRHVRAQRFQLLTRYLSLLDAERTRLGAPIVAQVTRAQQPVEVVQAALPPAPAWSSPIAEPLPSLPAAAPANTAGWNAAPAAPSTSGEPRAFLGAAIPAPVVPLAPEGGGFFTAAPTSVAAPAPAPAAFFTSATAPNAPAPRPAPNPTTGAFFTSAATPSAPAPCPAPNPTGAFFTSAAPRNAAPATGAFFTSAGAQAPGAVAYSTGTPQAAPDPPPAAYAPFDGRLTLEQYAYLASELERAPDPLAVIRWFQLDLASKQAEDGVWQRRFAADPATYGRFVELVTAYRNMPR